MVNGKHVRLPVQRFGVQISTKIDGHYKISAPLACLVTSAIKCRLVGSSDSKEEVWLRLRTMKLLAHPTILLLFLLLL